MNRVSTIHPLADSGRVHRLTAVRHDELKTSAIRAGLEVLSERLLVQETGTAGLGSCVHRLRAQRLSSPI